MVRPSGRLLDHGYLSKPMFSVKDGDHFAVVCHVIRAPDAVGVAKVKGHATEEEVDQGRVRAEDRLGNIEADTAADQGRRHQTKDVMEVRRALLNPREHWFPVMLQLHRNMVAVSRVSVNDDRGGSAPDPLV